MVPQSLVPFVLDQKHNKVNGGHLGIKKTLSKIISTIGIDCIEMWVDCALSVIFVTVEKCPEEKLRLQ